MIMNVLSIAGFICGLVAVGLGVWANVLLWTGAGVDAALGCMGGALTAALVACLCASAYWAQR